MALAGISTLGVSLQYGVETTAGERPTAWTTLTRINSIGSISMDTEQIDASALEDTKSAYIAGRADTGGNVEIQFNLTPDTISEWQTLISRYKTAHSSNLQMHFKVSSAGLGGTAFYFIAEPPLDIPMPESSQNELWVCTIPLSIVEYVGLD